MRKSKFLFLPCIFLALAVAVGCSASSNAGNDKTAPLEHLLNALESRSVEEYEKAFPESFCTLYKELFSNYEDTVALLLSATDEVDESAYGVDHTVRYELKAQTKLDVDTVEPSFRYDALDKFDYTFPENSVEHAYALSVRVTRSGSFGSSVQDMTLTVLYLNGAWVLHPKHFGTVLNPIL